jgi:hypothetical protein
MTIRILGLACAAAMTLAACEATTQDDRAALGAVAGGAAGVLAANALDANPEWTLIAGLAGAAAGTVVARSTVNSSTCAYSRGDGTYYTAPCP